MARKWQLQEAKNRFSEVVDLALEVGPQTVTRHGKEIAVIVSKEDFDKKRRGPRSRGTILGFLRGLSFKGSKLDVGRAQDDDRELEL